MHIRATTPQRATEDSARVAAALTQWFGGDVQVEDGVARLEVAGEGALLLAALRRRVWELRIIDTFRGQWLAGLHRDGQGATLRLSKQAAASGIVSFPASPHALGDLEVDVRLGTEDQAAWPDAEALGWWLAPATEDGRIVGEPDTASG